MDMGLQMDVDIRLLRYTVTVSPAIPYLCYTGIPEVEIVIAISPTLIIIHRVRNLLHVIAHAAPWQSLMRKRDH
jgi:hypothetical protein